MKTASELQRDVLEELKWEPSLQEGGIGVSAHDGVVTLSGHVHSYGEKTTAVRVAKRVEGVKGVADELIVKLLCSPQPDDAEIAEAALHALRWNVAVPHERLKVTVSNGWITLEGEVEQFFQRQAAANAVRDLAGVRGVTDRIALKPAVAPKEVEKKIRAALHRRATVDAAGIKVEMEGARVILRGHVRSWTEYDDAEAAAWAAPGVTGVENHLAVETEAFAEY